MQAAVAIKDRFYTDTLSLSGSTWPGSASAYDHVGNTSALPEALVTTSSSSLDILGYQRDYSFEKIFSGGNVSATSNTFNAAHSGEIVVWSRPTLAAGEKTKEKSSSTSPDKRKYITGGLTALPSVQFPGISDLMSWGIHRILPLAGYSDYSVPGWDGDDAIAISPRTLRAAREAIRTLDSKIPDPAAAPSADGTIGLEWWNGDACVYADFGPNDRIRTYINLGDGTPSEEDQFRWGEAGSELRLSNLLRRLYRRQSALGIGLPQRSARRWLEATV